jgi:Rrf2 family iron-sulfur cluster assembly transcriptional regulator
MSTIFSRQCEYAIQAVLYIALQPSGVLVSSRELADQLDVPYHFIGKILQKLTCRGLLISNRGKSGGFTLKQSASHITLLQIIIAIDGDDVARGCAIGFKQCSDETPCPLHSTWASFRDSVFAMLEQKSILDMAQMTHKPQYISHNNGGSRAAKSDK